MDGDYTDLGRLAHGRYSFSAFEHQVVAMLAHGFGEKVIGRHLRVRQYLVDECIQRLIRYYGMRSAMHLGRVYRAIEEVMPDRDDGV